MMKSSLFGAAMIAVVFCTGAAFAQSSMPAAVGQTAKGDTLTDAHGMTLYIFDKDANGKSACNGPCAANWPPHAAAAGSTATGDYSVVARDDGTMQWAYKGHPLYTWKNDKQPGDITGDGFLNNTWHVAQP